MTMSERIALDVLLGPDGHKIMQRISREIAAGAIFIYPTETVYGIGGNSLLSSAEKDIYKAKKRKPDNPLILIASQEKHFNRFYLKIPESAKFLSSAFWPGKLTLVIASEEMPQGLSIRISDHPFINRLYEFMNTPIFSTSANISGEPYNPDPEFIYNTFKNDIAFMIDAGPLPESAPSTIVKISAQNRIVILREGAISAQVISQKLTSAGYCLADD
jgi:L-threonylcarbamoyladenylate synthase